MIEAITTLLFFVSLAATIGLKHRQLHYFSAPYWLASWVGKTFAIHLLLVSCALMFALCFNPTQPVIFALVNLASALLYARIHINHYKTGRALLSAVVGNNISAHESVPKMLGLLPLKVQRKDVKRIKNIAYGSDTERHLLDIFIPNQPSAKPLPIVVQIHGGAWIMGNKNSQGQPLMNHLAANGWMGVAINYRLAPKHRFPAMINDIFLAIAWLQQHAAEYGGDPSFIAVTGGSAGGHLAALAALCQNDANFSGTCEAENCCINAAVPIYGRYDFLDETHILGSARTSVIEFMRSKVMAPTPQGDNSLLERASPIYRLSNDCPPMLVIHGGHDSMISYEEAERFVQVAKQSGTEQIDYLKLEQTQHAFDIFNTPQTYFLVRAINAYLNQQLSKHRNSYNVSPLQ